MTLYTIQNVFFGDEDCSRYTDFAKRVCESLIDKIPNASSIQNFSERTRLDQRSINNKSIADLIAMTSQKRKSYFDSLGIILSFGEPDYSPISFLERGLRCSASVCRVIKSYKIKELMTLLMDRKPKELKMIHAILSEFLQVQPSLWEKYDTMSAAFADARIQTRLEAKADERIAVPYATGFLVGKNYLLTNCHVLNALTDESKDEIQYFKAQFKYQRDAIDRKAKTVEFSLDASLCISDKSLDFTLIRVKRFLEDELDPTNPTQPLPSKELETRKSLAGIDFYEAGENFGWLPMLRQDMIVPPFSARRGQRIATQLETLKIEQSQIDRLKRQGLPGESVVIIQHPRGREKEIVLFNNRIRKISKSLLYYDADTDCGSSGSPVFNTDWQLVALHHAGLIRYREDGDFEVKSNLGIRVSKIVEYLDGLTDKPWVSEFLKQYVDQTRKGTIYLLAGHRRQEALESPYLEREVKLTQAISDWIKNNINGSGFQVVQVPEVELKSRKTAIDWINNQDYTVGDIALEIITDAYLDKTASQMGESPNQLPQAEELDSVPATQISDSKEKNLHRGATVYYIGAKAERKAHAEILLQALLNQVPQLASRETQSDRNTADARLPFCRDIHTPSLVLYLGFLEDSEDSQVLGIQDDGNLEQGKVEAIAKGIRQGLIDWGNTVSPIGFWRP
jgi:Trypsin-like peptidase domain